MKYNFDEIIDRCNNYSVKYDETKEKYGRNDLIPLWIADMDFKAAEPIINALKERATQGIYGYTSRPIEYFEAIKKWQLEKNNWEIDTSLMSHALGVLPMLANLMHTFLEKGDKVIIQPPVFHEFKNVIEAWDGKVIVNQLIENNGEYSIDFDDLREKAKQGAKFMIVCNPHNPIGKVWSKEELETIANICIENNITIISDEIYSDIMLWGNKHTPMASISEEIRKHTITCTSSTKTFNLAGLQVATVVFPNLDMKNQYDNILKKIETYRNNAFSIVANTIAFNEGKEWFEQVTDYIEENIKYAIDYINKYIPQIKVNTPDSTYLLWLDCRSLNLNGDELLDFFINKAQIAPNDGRIFGEGGEGYMRINIACSRKVLEKAMHQLKVSVDEYLFDKYELLCGC
jgi:cystathionine beta-lyase